MCQQPSSIGDFGADELADLMAVSPVAAEAEPLVDDRLAHADGKLLFATLACFEVEFWLDGYLVVCVVNQRGASVLTRIL